MNFIYVLKIVSSVSIGMRLFIAVCLNVSRCIVVVSEICRMKPYEMVMKKYSEVFDGIYG